MADERSFLNDSGVFVSNTRVVIHGTTYATANITSVRKHIVPAKNGCAAALMVVGGLATLGTLVGAVGAKNGDAWGSVVFAAAMLIAGIAWLISNKPTYHVMLATAGGERSGLTSRDEALADRVTTAIADAIIHRG